jgi:hypothetical protein
VLIIPLNMQHIISIKGAVEYWSIHIQNVLLLSPASTRSTDIIGHRIQYASCKTSLRFAVFAVCDFRMSMSYLIICIHLGHLVHHDKDGKL